MSITVNPLLSQLGLFILSLFEWGGGGREGDNRDGGLFERDGLFNVEKTMVSVLHKELQYNWKSSSARSFKSCIRGSE